MYFSCVLLTTGSFNPIHRGHIANLRQAKDYLQSKKKWNVIAGFISPTQFVSFEKNSIRILKIKFFSSSKFSDDYVNNKLGSHHWIKAEDRSLLCEEVIREEHESHWLFVTRGEQNYRHFVDFPDVIMDLSKFLNEELYKNDLKNSNLTVVYVCGLDHFNRCRYVENLSCEKNVACLIIYRSNEPEDRINAAVKSKKNLFYISRSELRNPTEDISSTKIRESRDGDLTRLTYPCVISFLKAKYQTNQQQSSWV